MSSVIITYNFPILLCFIVTNCIHTFERTVDDPSVLLKILTFQLLNKIIRTKRRVQKSTK